MQLSRRKLIVAALAAPTMVGISTAVAATEPGKDSGAQKDEHQATPPWDAASVKLTSKEMAPGVFAVMPDNVFTKDHVATTGGFVIGEKVVWLSRPC